MIVTIRKFGSSLSLYLPLTGGTLSGAATIDVGSNVTPSILTLKNIGANGVSLKLIDASATPNKYLRSTSGVFQLVNSAFTVALLSVTDAGATTLTGVSLKMASTTAIPAGGTAGTGFTFSTATNFGAFFGSGAPTLAAAKGSLYLRSDGSGVGDRMYINTDGSTTWTAVVTVA